MSTTSFQAVLHKALSDYSDQVGIDLENHFANELRGRDSPDDVLSLFEDKIKGFKVDRFGNAKLTKWLGPVVKVIHALSDILGEAVAPLQPAKAIFVGMDVLIAATDGVGPRYDALVDLFECIENSLKRFRIYTKIPLTPSMTDIFINILVELLSVFALATKEIKQGRLKKLAKKLLGESKIEAMLQSLDRLTVEGAAQWQTLEAVHALANNPRVVINDGDAPTDGMQATLDIVQELTRQRQDAEIIWERQAEVLRQQAETAKREIKVAKRELEVQRAEQEVAKREVEVQHAEQEAQLKEREARVKEAEVLLGEETLRKEQRIEEAARRMSMVTRWREEQPVLCGKGRRVGERWMGTKNVVVSTWGKLKGRISRIDERDMVRTFQDNLKDEDELNGNGIGVSSLSIVQNPQHLNVEQRRSTDVTSADTEDMTITAEDE
ncbi:hypothetical protein EI94DRAFT_1746778 [Lactarius quietus]|nr:hypothetical protein EI94DRAFT_1746778 [Lactarius quietus]